MTGLVLDISRSLGEDIISLGAIAGALLILGGFVAKLSKGFRRLVKRINVVLDLTEYELRHNGGGSIKDHVAQAAKDSARSLDEVQTLGHQFNAYVLANAKEKEAMWSAVEAIANSHPPGTPNVDLSIAVTERKPNGEEADPGAGAGS